MEGSSAANGLRLQIEGLQASRARIAAAAMAERRRIERELHDGVQQHLVAVIVNLQLARELADDRPGGRQGRARRAQRRRPPGARVGPRAGTRALPLGPSRSRAGRGRPRRRGRIRRAGARRRGSDRGVGRMPMPPSTTAASSSSPTSPSTPARTRGRRCASGRRTAPFGSRSRTTGWASTRGAARRDGGLARAADAVGALGGSLEVDAAARARARASPEASRSRRERLRVSPARRGT